MIQISTLNLSSLHLAVFTKHLSPVPILQQYHSLSPDFVPYGLQFIVLSFFVQTTTAHHLLPLVEDDPPPSPKMPLKMVLSLKMPLKMVLPLKMPLKMPPPPDEGEEELDLDAIEPPSAENSPSAGSFPKVKVWKCLLLLPLVSVPTVRYSVP